MKTDLTQAAHRPGGEPGRKRRKQRSSGNQLFGMPYRVAMALVYGLGFLTGGILFWMVGLVFATVVTVGDPLQMQCTFRLGMPGLLLAPGVALVFVATAFVAPLDETWQRFGMVAAGCGFFLTGIWVHAVHKIEIHPDHFVVRGPFNPFAQSYPLGPETRVEARYPQERGWRRRRQWIPVYHITADQNETRLCRDYHHPSTWFFALPHLTRGAQVVGPDGH